jgi:predicted small secreted protein
MKISKPALVVLLAPLILSSTLLTSCNFSKGTKKDLLTGLSFSYNGFMVQDVLLVNPANKRMTDNKVPINTRIAIVALGLNNYGLKDGKVFPGMALLVTDKSGTPVLKADDLFAGDPGHPPAEATELRGDVTIAKPMVTGETYHVKMRIWDKVKAENELNAETDLVVQ